MYMTNRMIAISRALKSQELGKAVSISSLVTNCYCNSSTMGCPHIRVDDPRALASELSYVQVNKQAFTILYHLHQCRPCTSRDISC